MTILVNRLGRVEDAGSSDIITVFVVDDHDIVREGLSAILGRETDLRVVGQAESADEALAVLPALDPAVVVIDHRLPGMDGIALCLAIAEAGLRAQVVLLSAMLDDGAVDAALAAGARAYVVKDVEASELMRAIRAAAHGMTLIDQKIAGRVGARTWDESRQPISLPPSQLKVLRLLVAGRSVAEIAIETGLSHHTVKSYLRAVYRRLGVSSRAEAASIALRRGLV